MQRLCGNDMAVPEGKVVYTGLFNEEGNVSKAICAPVRLAADAYYVVSGAGRDGP